LALPLIALTACGHSTGPNEQEATKVDAETANAPDSSPGESTGTAAADPSEAEKWPGKMTVVYEEATTPEAVEGKKFMEERNLLPQLADDINGLLKLPFDIPLKGKQCGVANDFWDRSEKAMVLCYEDASATLGTFQKLDDPNPPGATFHSELAAFYHELGHMVIDIYQLPATGRSEDNADQVAAYMLLRPEPDGKIDPDSIDAIRDTARYYEAQAGPDNNLDESLLADIHSPSKVRMYNNLCWAYGADPSQTEDFVADGLLPPDRADRCADEFEQLKNAWTTLLTPYFK
jgi:hypothetical protein